MRVPILPALGVGAAAVAFAIAIPAGAGAAAAPGTAGHSSLSHLVQPSKDNEKPCKGANQRDNDNGVGIVSQMFTDFPGSPPPYDAAGADDFTITGKTALCSDVVADGAYFNGVGPADSINVTIYKDNGGTPGAVYYTANRCYQDLTGTGTFQVEFKGKECSAPQGQASPQGKFKGDDLKLKPGTYWVSVQVVMAFSSGGEWGWNTNNTVRGNPSQWENPGNGFSTGCTSWTATTSCIASGEGGDYSFAILK